MKGVSNRKRSARKTKCGGFPWSELNPELRSLVISRVHPEDMASLIVALTHPGNVTCEGRPLDHALWCEDRARRFFACGPSEGSDIVEAARMFDFETTCQVLYGDGDPRSAKRSFHRDSFAGYARRLDRDVMRVAELGSFKKRCGMIARRMRHERVSPEAVERVVVGTFRECRSRAEPPFAPEQDVERALVHLCRDIEIRFTLFMTRKPLVFTESSGNKELTCKLGGTPVSDGSTTVSFVFSGGQCDFCREAKEDASRRSSRSAPMTPASFRNENAHAFDAWGGTPCHVLDDDVRVVRETAGSLLVDEGAWVSFEKAACGMFGPDRCVETDGENKTWTSDSHDLEVMMEVFVKGSERPAFTLRSDEPYGLERREGSEEWLDYKVFVWDDVLRFMVKVGVAGSYDPWDHNRVTFDLGFPTRKEPVSGRKKTTKVWSDQTLDDEERWFRCESTRVPSLRFLERMTG